MKPTRVVLVGRTAFEFLVVVLELLGEWDLETIDTKFARSVFFQTMATAMLSTMTVVRPFSGKY